MPEEATSSVEESAAAPYVFPFDVPADLSTASEETLRALHIQVREHAQTFASPDPAANTSGNVQAIRACVDLARQITDTINERRSLAAEASALLDDDAFAEIADAEVDDLTGDDDGEDGDVLPDESQPEPQPEPAPAPPAPAVTAASRRTIPRVRDVARSARAPQLPAATQRTGYGTMRSAAPLAGYPVGHQFSNFGELVNAVEQQIERHPQRRRETDSYHPNRRPVTVHVAGEGARAHQLMQYNRAPVAEIRRNFADDMRLTEGIGEQAAYRVAEHVASEKRLPGGSLTKSAEAAFKAGRSLTAAAGWCAPSETIYDLVETETEDGVLDVPEMETPRGGWNIPTDGGPEFASIYGQLGNGGDTHLTEAEVIADTPKISIEIPCPPFSEVRLGVDYFSLTGGMLQRRGYPEMVARFSRAAVVGLTHKINKGVIEDIVAGSTNAGMITPDAAGDDAASALMAAVDLAVMDAHYRNRGGYNTTMEVVLPRWVLLQIRAALSRRTGNGRLDVTDAEILQWFTIRNAVPRFVVDWQDAFSNLPTTGPGGSTPLARLPTTVQFVVYPAGTWVKAVQDVVSLDTIYDSTLLTTNQYIAMFVETGWAMLKMQPLSRRYTVHVDPSGVVGCCDAPDISLLS